MSEDEKGPGHYQPERQDAAHQNGTLDAVTSATKINPFGGGRGMHFGKTSFEGHELNQMIDIVESASPELVESAGTSLIDARDAINDAANELSRNLGDVDWEGEAHGAFYKWGMDLVTTALDLAGYADTVGTQVMAASSGLASVRKAMPPRDGRSDPKSVADIPEAKRVDGNAEYAAATKAEGDRQEAINQMYRLASFYSVSAGSMKAAEEPVFPKMPDVGVPVPPAGIDPIDPADPGATQSASGSGITHHRSADSGVIRARAEDLSPSHVNVEEPATPSQRHVGTEIDSVGTVPPQETTKPTSVTPPSASGPTGVSAGPVPPVGPSAAPPLSRGLTGRTSGFGGTPGTKAPASSQGRPGGVPGGTPAGRTGTGPTGPMGRAAASGQAGGRATGPTGRGVIGGAPKAGGSAAKQAGGVPRGPVTGTGATNPGRAGAGRITNGVVGGKPVTGAVPGTNGSRVPRGTVIGSEGTPTSRATGERPGQRGVIGAQSSTTGSGQVPRRPVGSPDGVIGTPKGRGSGTRNSGHTPGGTGVTRGPVGEQRSSETRSRRDERRDRASATDDRPDKSED